MDTTAHFITDADASSTMRKVALICKGLSREDQEPVHMALLTDTSGSMDSHQKLVNCKKSMSFVLELMRDTDAISILTFGDDANVLSSRVETTSTNKLGLLGVIDSIETHGCTNMSAGLLEARNTVESRESVRKQGIILLTDGHANLGVWDPDRMFQIVKGIVDSRDGLIVHTIGYGFDHNVDLLSKIAEWTGGTYSVVNNLEDVATVFGSVLGSMVSTTAQTVKAYLPAGFKMISTLPSEKVGAGGTLVRVGDIQSEVSQILLLEVPVAAAHETIVITGYDLVNHVSIQKEILIGPVPSMTDEESANLDFAFVRVEVVALIQEIRSAIAAATPPSASEKASFMGRILNLSLRLDGVPGFLSSISNVMKADLTALQRALNRPTRNRQELDVMSQHANVYSGGRGMTSMGSTAEPHNDNLQSPLMSRSSRQYAELLRTRSHNPDPTDD